MYKNLNNTADIELVIISDDETGLINETVKAFCDTITNISSIKKRMDYPLKVSGENLEEIIYNLLNELIYLFDTKLLLFNSSKILHMEDNHVNILLSGEVYKPENHCIKKIIKAITLSEYNIKRSNDSLLLHLIFDV